MLAICFVDVSRGASCTRLVPIIRQKRHSDVASIVCTLAVFCAGRRYVACRWLRLQLADQDPVAASIVTMAEPRPTRDVRFVERGEEHSAAWQRQQAEQLLVPGTDYSLPRRHQADQSIDWTGIFRASAHEPIPSSNKGYLLLQKSGWQAGTGLGSGQTGVRKSAAPSTPICLATAVSSATAQGSLILQCFRPAHSVPVLIEIHRCSRRQAAPPQVNNMTGRSSCSHRPRDTPRHRRPCQRHTRRPRPHCTRRGANRGGNGETARAGSGGAGG